MRVLISTSTFPVRVGDGLPRFVQDLGEALARHCEVAVLAPGAPGAARRERMGALDVYRFPYFLPRSAQRLAYADGMIENWRASWLARLQPPGYLLCQALAVRRLARELGADVVNSHWLLPQGLSGAWARGRPPGFRHVVTLHGADSHLLGRLPFGAALARYAVARSDALIAVSGSVRAELDAALGRPSQAVVQPVGAELARFREPAPAVAPRWPQGYLLFVGRLVGFKGVDILLRALPRVRERWPGLGLLIVGSGPLEAELRGLASEQGVADVVEWAGRQPHEGVAAYLQGCRAAVVPSVFDASGRSEGMPGVVAEALAAGARVVASAVGGIPDAIRHGESGWLARPGDADDLAAQILTALDDPEDSRVRRAAAAAAEGMDWGRVAERYLETFRSALGAGARGRASAR